MQEGSVDSLESAMGRNDSNDSGIGRRSGDEAPTCYGLCSCRTYAGRFLHSITCPSFPDAEEEAEYREHTYSAGRAFLVRMLLGVVCLYSANAVVAAYVNNSVSNDQSRINAYLVMRGGFFAAGVVVAGALHWMPRMRPSVATLICVLLLYTAVIISYSTSSLVVFILPRILPFILPLITTVCILPRRWWAPSRRARRRPSSTWRSIRSSCPSSRSITSRWPCSCSPASR